ncbi:MAG: DUF4212 domain-containing protein [Myxococcales bacterium]|nr:DUF4212 domain-containing protein [Myxococcales bacterium]
MLRRGIGEGARVDGSRDDGARVDGSQGEAREPRPGAARRYWRTNLRLLTSLLAIWFVASFGLGILFVRPLNAFHLGGFPLGFWFAQQGAIVVFVVLVFVYARAMDRIEKRMARDARDH